MHTKLPFIFTLKNNKKVEIRFLKLRDVDGIWKNYNDVMAKINTASEELTNNKADRKTLAAMLASMADNLTNQE